MIQSRDLLAVLVAGGALLAGCSTEQGAAADSKAEHSTVTEIAGSTLKLVTLSARAQERLGITTVGVVRAPAGRTLMPYSAVLYDVDGRTWAFVAAPGGAFRRVAVTIDDIVEDDAFLTSGPAPGARVVTAGAAELYGAELGVGK